MTYRLKKSSSFQIGWAIFFLISFSLASVNAQQQNYSDSFDQIDHLVNQDLNQALAFSKRLEKDPLFVTYLGFREELMLKQAQIYSGLGAFNQADSLLRLVSDLNIKNTSPEYRAHFFILKAIAMKLSGNYSEAVLQMNQAELIYTELESFEAHFEVNMQYAQIYSLLGNNSRAIEYIDIALEEGADLSPKQMFALLSDKALLYGQLGNQKEQYYSLERLDDLPISDTVQISQGMLGLAWANYYLLVHNYDLALQFLNEAESIFKEEKDRRHLNAVYMEKAGVFSMKHNEFAQRLFLQQALEQAELLSDVSLIFEGRLALASLFFRQHENDSSCKYVNSVIESSPFLKLKIQAYDILKKIQLTQNNYKDALLALELRQALSDSLKSLELNKALASSQLDFDISKYEEDKAEIENQIEVHQLETQNHILVIRLFGSSLLLAMIFGFSLYYFFKFKNERRNSLRSQKLIYLQLNAHFVFNSLTAIQSLILKNKVVNAEHYLQMFADLMQNIIKSSTHSRVALHEELSFLMAYMQLQKLRFGDDLNYEITISENIDPQQFSVPPFLIYPYLEYAIEFCIQKKGAKGLIGIQLGLEDDHLLIKLEDFGIGFLAPQKAFLKRPNQKEVSLFDLTSDRMRELNSWRFKKYHMQLEHSEEESGEKKSVLQFKIKVT